MSQNNLWDMATLIFGAVLAGVSAWLLLIAFLAPEPEYAPVEPLRWELPPNDKNAESRNS